MSIVDVECDTLTAETVNSVTLAQDRKGKPVFHCPRQEIDLENKLEQPHNQLCFSKDVFNPHESSPCISVVVSENDPNFNIAMTATTDIANGDLHEETVTQVQILQCSKPDDPSSVGNEEVTPVSQAWFTTKEDKDSLTNKGHKWKKGMWSKEEIGLLMCNIDRYLKVVLCGGSARIPKLQQLIKDLFPDVELLNSIPPDEVIPIGAAIEAALLLGKDNLSLEEETQAIECSARDILVKEVDECGVEKFTVLLPSGTPLPARRQHTLHAPGSISSVCLGLYESVGKNSEAEEYRFAQIILRELEKKDGKHDITTVLTMKRDGSLHVTCTDEGTGKCEMITIEVA